MSNLKSIRKAKGFTQRELAQALRVTPAAVSQWERPAAKIPKAQLAPIAKFLGVTKEELIAPPESSELDLPDGCCRQIYKSQNEGSLGEFVCPRVKPGADYTSIDHAEQANYLIKFLESITKLYEQGFLTEDEFTAAKHKVLG